jgi:hypothetical protein
MPELLTLSEIHEVYTDAYLTDDANHLLFLSVWGRDTALQEFLARLQLPRSENGIKDFHITGTEINQYVIVPNVENLDKAIAKTSRNTILGELTQLWIYDKIAVSADLANHRALMLYSNDDVHSDPWPIIKNVCPLPLLNEWRETFLKKCFEKKWIYLLDKGFGVGGYFIEINVDELELVITEMIQRDQLSIN